MSKLRNLITGTTRVPLFRGCLAVLFVATCAIAGMADAVMPDRPLDVPYEPTHPKVVEAMLKLGGAGPNIIHYDLGCGDGRVVIMGVKKFNVKHAYGIDINKQRLREAAERAEAMDVTDKVTFLNADIFNSDFSKADLVTAYLLDHINLKVRPILFAQLRPGSRVVTHEFHMSDWRPDKIDRHPLARGERISLWIIPAPVGGDWEWSTALKSGAVQASMKLTQEFQDIAGKVQFAGGPAAAIRDPKMDGKSISFTANAVVNGKAVAVKFQGAANGDNITGTQVWTGADLGGTYPWKAKRKAATVIGRWKIDIPQKNIFNGVLNIRKEGTQKLVASFFGKDGNMEIRVHDVYIWGTSVYFRLPLSYFDFVLFKGELNNDAGTGKAYGMKVKEDYKEGIYDPPSVTWNSAWTATRVR
jgi:SAM-dependent methyltransferase